MRARAVVVVIAAAQIQMRKIVSPSSEPLVPGVRIDLWQKLEPLLSQLRAIGAAGLTIEFDRKPRLYCHPFLRHGERFPSGSVSWTSDSPPLSSGRSNPISLKAALGLRPILQPEAKKLKRRLFKGLHFFVGSLAPHASS
jgi:hypothetical protein